MHKFRLLICSIIFMAMALPSAAQVRFIRTNAVGGDTRIGLFLADGDDVVSTANGVPQVRMRLDLLPDMITVPKGNIKVEVYRSSDETELVAVFNYPVRRGQDHINLKMNLPEFKNQSENFDFIVYDTDGNARTKYRNSFASKELITLQPKPPMLELNDDKVLNATELEYIAKKFAIQVVPAGQPTGMQKKDGVYNLQVPLRKATGPITQNRKIVNRSLDFDEVGSLEDRANFDDAKKGTVFLDEDTGLIYVKASDADADWTSPIEFTSNQEDNGDTTGGSGTNTGGTTTIITHPVTETTTTVVQQLNGSDLANGSIAVEKIEPVIATKTVSLPLKDAVRSVGAVFGTVATGTMPVIRYESTGAATWSLVLPADLVRDDLAYPDIKVKISWSPSNNSAQLIDWRLSHASYNNGDLINANSMTDIDLSSAAPAAALTLTETEFSIPVSSLQKQLTLKLGRTDSRVIKPNLSSISIEYPGRVLE